MTQRYWIGGFFVDVPRNQITHNKQAQTLPPKALAVLTYLAERQGEVVSQDELLNHVWKGTVVSPNTLQRCIAQLRKAFGDDGKAQSFIKTHAKKGYSLDSDIRWDETSSLEPTSIEPAPIDTQLTNTKPIYSTPVNADVPHQPQATTSRKTTSLTLSLLLVCLVAAVTIAIAFIPSSKPSNVLQINDIRMLTSTDNRELASAYSPDGQYIVFQRFPEVMCRSHLWAKHIETQQEFQLTQSLGSYGSLAFSHDGSTLSFVKENNCTAPVEQKKCFYLQSLNFAKALSSPQPSTTLMECKNTEIKSPIWINDDTIALLQKAQRRWRLIGYSTSDDTSAPLYEVSNGSIVSFDYAKRDNIIALTTVHESGKLHIEKLTTSGDVLSSSPIDYQSVIPKYSYIYPNFSPVDEHLIFSTGKQLFTVAFDGSISRVSMPLTDAIGTPFFHPFDKKMLAIKGHYDSDIVAVPLSQFSPQVRAQISNPEQVEIAHTTLVRSMKEESRASYQPGGSLIAYSSEADGTSQIWTVSNEAESTTFPIAGKQFSRFPTNTYVRDIQWAKDGASILVNASAELKRFDLTGKVSDIDLPYPVYSLFHWDSEQHLALANILHRGVITFVRIDLTTGDFTTLSNRDVTWAVQTDNGTHIYTDAAGRFWQSGNVEYALISALQGQGSDRHFVAKGNTLYGVNDDYKLWRFTLQEGELEILGQLPDTVDYISDVNDNVILITHRVAARKDVVELTVQ
ncbi:winged helix-turn-helix domain-containing protein [Alteromonas gracilis]|uniref:winged helix-turn-helix domain-containing protein n=1 Tax=Alteromonas gracilis TaxID=1479524 RepID=UPI0037353369